MTKKRLRKADYRLLLWMLPVLVFALLVGGNLWAWQNTSALINELVKNRAFNAAEQMFLRLELIFYERGKDLSHLATVIQSNTVNAQERFLHDASGIISREPAFESIGYLDTVGNIILSVPDQFCGLMVLDRREYVSRVVELADGPLATGAITLTADNIVQGILIPVGDTGDGELRVIGVVAGMVYIDNIVFSTMSIAMPAQYMVRIVVDTVELFVSAGLDPAEANGISVRREIMGVGWSITVFPPVSGELNRLHEDNLYRLLLNLLAALVASALLALAFIASHKAGVSRRELAASEQRYRRLTENARDMVFRIGLPRGDFEYVSPAALELTGYTVEEFYAQPQLFKKLIDPEWVGYYETNFNKILQGQIEPVYEFKIINKFAEKRWLHLRPVLVRDESGRPSAVEATATDITQLRNAMIERENLIAELENKNAELERYAYTVSHELKTPLITIRGFLGYLEKEAVEGDINGLHQDLALIQSATDTMQRLLEGLIELTRVGRSPGEVEDIPFIQLVESSVEVFEHKIKESGIKLEVAPDMPVVHGHRTELLELVQNLLENSIKFMGDTVEPTIKFGWCRVDGDTVFHITDNGIGLEPKYRNRIFGIFTKLNPSSEGAGVGLALAQRIVASHGGWIRAESPGPGKGTKICFKLPVVES